MERWLGLITQQAIRRGSFRSVGELVQKIDAFARYPEEKIREEVAAGELKVLPLQGGGDMYGEIYLVLADPEGAGPGIRRLAEILREDVRSESEKPRPGERKMKASSPMGQASHA